MQRGQLIHESVFVNLKNTNIEPKARLYDSFEWSDVEMLKNSMMEKDLYTNVSALMSKLKMEKVASDEDTNALRALFTALGELLLIHC